MSEPATPKLDCPFCGRSALPVLYGRTSKEGMKWIQEGKAVSGGCMMDMKSPSHSCPNGHSFISDEVRKAREAMYQAFLERKKNGSQAEKKKDE